MKLFKGIFYLKVICILDVTANGIIGTLHGMKLLKGMIYLKVISILDMGRQMAFWCTQNNIYYLNNTYLLICLYYFIPLLLQPLLLCIILESSYHCNAKTMRIICWVWMFQVLMQNQVLKLLLPLNNTSKEIRFVDLLISCCFIVYLCSWIFYISILLLSR
jgi:hypothetical protein